MLRINQLAKELGVSNHEVLDALEKHLGVQGKSHSSNLSDEQVNVRAPGHARTSPGARRPPPPPRRPPPTAPKAVPPTIRIVKPTAAPPPPPVRPPRQRS